MEKGIKLDISVQVYSGREELDASDQELISQAQRATESAYAPYSRFLVGAALLLEGGSVILGSNQENASYPQGLCAERVALFTAGSQNPGRTIEAIAIAARNSTSGFLPVSPCGGCRQVMLEYEQKQKKPIRVLFYGTENEIYVADCVKVLIPFGFESSNLS